MTAVSEPSLGPAVNIVDAFAQNLKEMKMKKKATRVHSLQEDPAAPAQLTGDLLLQEKKDRRSGRRLPRKTGGNSNTNLAALVGPSNGSSSSSAGLTLTRSSTDTGLSLLGRVETLKENAGGTVDPDELLKKRRDARRTTAGGAKKGMPRKSLNASGNLSSSNLALQLSQNNLAAGSGMQRSTTDPTLSLQARMEKLKQKQKEMPDPDEMLKQRRKSNSTSTTSKLFGSAPSLPALTTTKEDREQRRLRRTSSRGQRQRLSRTTSAGRIHDEMELPVLTKYDYDDIHPVQRSKIDRCGGAGGLPELQAYLDSAKSA